MQSHTGNINCVTGKLRAENQGIQYRALVTGVGEEAWPVARPEQGEGNAWNAEDNAKSLRSAKVLE